MCVRAVVVGPSVRVTVVEVALGVSAQARTSSATMSGPIVSVLRSNFEVQK